jgi:hypothetical protein
MAKSKKASPRKSTLVPTAEASVLLNDVRRLIELAREATAGAVNSALVLLYWGIGDRIRRKILRKQRAEYGKQIVGALSRQSAAEHGRGFTDLRPDGYPYRNRRRNNSVPRGASEAM